MGGKNVVVYINFLKTKEILELCFVLFIKFEEFLRNTIE
jgi:hypothetical protein